MNRRPVLRLPPRRDGKPLRLGAGRRRWDLRGLCRTAVLLALALWRIAPCLAAEWHLLAETTTLTLTRESCRVYLQQLDGPFGLREGITTRLAGAEPIGEPVVFAEPGCVAAFTQTTQAKARTSFLTVASTRTLQAAEHGVRLIDPGWRPVAQAAVVPRAKGEFLLVALQAAEEAGTRSPAAGGGRMEVWQLRNPRAPVLEEGSAIWRLPGSPVAAAVLAGTHNVAVLCHDAGDGTLLLHVRDVLTGQVGVDSARLEQPGVPGMAPASGAVIALDSGHVVLVVPGNDPERVKGGPVTWVHCLKRPDFETSCAPVRLPGRPAMHAGGVPAGEAAFWVATHDANGAFAYATKMAVREGQLRKVLETSFQDADAAPRFALGGPADAEALAGGRRLRVLSGSGEAGTVNAVFEHDIASLAWVEAGLAVGAGSRVYIIDPATGERKQVLQLQNGAVAFMAAIEGVALRGDADSDGILDTVDPEPRTPTPRLDVPSLLAFDGEAVGRQLRAVVLDAPFGEGAKWQVSYDRQRMPWLRLHPRQGTVPGWFLAGIDPLDYGSPEGALQGRISIAMTGPRGRGAAFGSPVGVFLRVIPKESPVRRILWILPGGSREGRLRAPGDPFKLAELAGMLAGPPHYYSHVVSTEAVVPSLRPYTLAVIAAEPAAKGVVTQPALIEYLSVGGGVLFLGSHLPEDTGRSLTRWLAPFGITLDLARRVEGVFPRGAPHPATQYWRDFRFQDACAVRVDDPAKALVPPGDTNAAMAALQYGDGRLAVLAGTTPLESRAMVQPKNRLFAAGLFNWVEGAGGTVPDLDSDGLPDSVEDTDGDGVVDPGETNRLSPDTDGDGVPDGLEDTNRDGRAGVGETNPRLYDTDRDGIADGADLAPLGGG